MSGKRYDVAGIGSMVVDAIHRVPRLGGPDQKILLEAYPPGSGSQVVLRRVGGVTLNHLGWARLFGLEVAIFGKQADDENGRFLRRGMAHLGIEPALDLSGSASSFAQVFVDPDGNRTIYMAPGGTAELTPDEIEARHRSVIESAVRVTTEISQVPLAAARRVLEIARDAGAETVIDLDRSVADAVPELGSEAEFHALLSCARVIKASHSAAQGSVERGRSGSLAEALARRYGADAVLVTLGSEGAESFCEGRAARLPAARVRVVDSTGAGDAFLGGVIAGRHLGLDFEDAFRLGNACGGACCEQAGAFPETPGELRERALELYRELGGTAFEVPPVSADLPGDRALEHFLEVAPDQLGRAAERLDRAQLGRAVELIVAAEEKSARVHVTGVGKAEQVARYAAGLLSSTGTPATFLDATEAVHGGVGQLRPEDVLVAISNSGETLELLRCCEVARALGARLVALTGAPASGLARAAEIALDCGVAEEGGPLGLAPRASVLAQILAVAALSVALQDRKQLSREAYHQRHPAGALGRRSDPGS